MPAWNGIGADEPWHHDAMEESKSRRYVIVGGPGVGKTTVASALAQQCDLVRVELDELCWGPHWTSADSSELRARVSARIDHVDGWVADGNYLDEVSSVLWGSADVIVWLDLPRRTGFVRAVRRSFRRVVSRQELWNGNRETWRVLTPSSLRALWRRWPDYPRRIETLLRADPSYKDKLVRLSSQRKIVWWTSEQQLG